MVAAESGSTVSVRAAPVGRKARPAATQPNTLDMIVEAITSINERKGTSVPAIKAYIVEKYSTDPNMLKYRLKKAIVKGMSQEILSRPKGMEEAGTSLNGRFRLNKARITAMEKAKQLKPKPKPKTEKPKVQKPKVEKADKNPKKVVKTKETKPVVGVKKTKDLKTKKAKATASKSPGKKDKSEKTKKTSEKVKKAKNKAPDKKTPKKSSTKKSK